MGKQFKVINGFSVYERGEVLICKNDEDLKVDTKVRINGKEYTIQGKEYWNKLLDPPKPNDTCALTFTPNAPICSVDIGDIIEIIDE